MQGVKGWPWHHVPSGCCRHLPDPSGGSAKLSGAQDWGLSRSAQTPLLAADPQAQIPQDIFPPLLQS